MRSERGTARANAPQGSATVAEKAVAEKIQDAHRRLAWARETRLVAAEFRAAGHEAQARACDDVVRGHLRDARWLRLEAQAIRASVARGELS